MRLLTLMEAPAKRASCLMCCPFFPMMAPTACVGMNKFTTSCSGSCQGEQRFISTPVFFHLPAPTLKLVGTRPPKLSQPEPAKQERGTPWGQVLPKAASLPWGTAERDPWGCGSTYGVLMWEGANWGGSVQP